jgi:hypothetical protein
VRLTIDSESLHPRRHAFSGIFLGVTPFDPGAQEMASMNRSPWAAAPMRVYRRLTTRGASSTSRSRVVKR